MSSGRSLYSNLGLQGCAVPYSIHYAGYDGLEKRIVRNSAACMDNSVSGEISKMKIFQYLVFPALQPG